MVRPIWMSAAALSVVVWALFAGCDREKREEERSLTEIAQSYDRLQPRLLELRKALGNLRRDVDSLAADAPGGPEWRSKYFAADEVLGVLDAKMKWLAEEIASVRRRFDKDRVSSLREAITATAGELGQVDKVAALLLHEKVRLQWLAGLLKAPYQHRLPTGYEIKAAKEGLESRLVDFIEHPAQPKPAYEVDFDRLGFLDGTDRLDLRASRSQLENVAQVLRAYPAVKLKIAAYADGASVGEGRKRAAELARAVRTALAQSGVNSDRLVAEGHGAKSPPCGRRSAQNCGVHGRRITVTVTAR